LKRTWLFLVILVVVPIVCAAEAWQINAPGGTEIDLEREVVFYYGAGSNQVEAVLDRTTLFGDRLEFYRLESRLVAKGRVLLRREQPEFWEFSGSEIVYDSQKQEVLLRTGGKVVFGEKRSKLEAGEFSGNLKEQKFIANRQCLLSDRDGTLFSNQMNADLNSGMFVAKDNVVFQTENLTVRAKKAVYNQKSDIVKFSGKPLVTRGKETFTAVEISYDRRNKKIKATGPVEYKSQNASIGSENGVH
jgi:lipopolysaccharide assembly outer membrane protein LptD (OstA)